MVTISNEKTEGLREDIQKETVEEDIFVSMTNNNASSPRNSDMPSDATQRVKIDPETKPAPRRTNTPPQRRTAPQETPSRRRTASVSARNGKKQTEKKGLAALFANQKMTVIILSVIAVVMLVSLVVTILVMTASPKDDGLILNNVYAAGVNLGGKTPEQAKAILREATSNTYTKLDMVVEVHDSEVILSPSKTGAKLDVDAVVEEAYNYGRVGSRAEQQNAKNQALTSSHVISVIPYLNLDEEYIQDAVDDLGSKYVSTFSDPSYRIEGTRPDLNTAPENIDLNHVHQTLYITLGTPEYGLDTDKLYDQIMEAYNTNLFQVVGEISVVAPEALDLDALYAQYCVKPVDAVLNETTYEVTAETYGYGFQLEDVRSLVEKAGYGDEIKVSMCFLRPQITAEELKDGLFETQLAFLSTPSSVDKDWNINLKLACRAIDGLILKADEVFIFNDVVGMPTAAKGYKEVSIYVGKDVQEVLGGGISQIASSLYYCALKSDLEILDRSNHTYVPSFTDGGLDAEVSYGNTDLSFKNTTGRPIRIEAEVTDAGVLQVSIWGTGNEEYSVEIVYETVNTFKPATLTSIMLKDNPDGYKDGDVLVQPITGYDICTYRVYHYADTAKEDLKQLVAVSHYDKLDKVVVKIQTTPIVPPTDPTETTDPSDSTGSTEESTTHTVTSEPTNNEDE